MKLYDISKSLIDLEQMLSDGIDPDQLADALDDVNEAFQEKAAGILYLLRNMASDADALKAEEVRLSGKRTIIENQISGIKDYLIMNMVSSKITQIDNGVIKASYIKPKPVLLIADDEKVDGVYKIVSHSVRLDKRTMLNDLKAGVVIQGASIGESKASISIK